MAWKRTKLSLSMGQRNFSRWIALTVPLFIFSSVYVNRHHTRQQLKADLLSSTPLDESSTAQTITQKAAVSTKSHHKPQPFSCFKKYHWIEQALDKHFEPAKASAAASQQTSEEAIAMFQNITWVEGYHPGHDLVSLIFDTKAKRYVMKIDEEFPPNQRYKRNCILGILQSAFKAHEPELRAVLKGKEIKFVIGTEDFGMVWRGQNAKLPGFALCTDDHHIDIPVPDFTYGCYPEARYKNTSWPAIAQLLKKKSDMVHWTDRYSEIFHRSNWGVGPRQTLMPLLSQLQANATDKDLLGAPLDIADTGFQTSNKHHFVWLDGMCDYKYQIHTAGFSYSAALKYKLACGSLVFKLDSKYVEFYEPALQDGVHYVGLRAAENGESIVPDDFMKTEVPKIKQAVVDTIELDDLPKIAAAGQEWAMHNLSPEALNCYWLGALMRYSELYLSTTPTSTPTST